MDLSIIIVSWNVKDKLRENLHAIFRSSRAVSLEVFVVDNASVDGTTEMIRNEFAEVKLIANTDNRGFARANNQAIKDVKGRYVLLLNPDMLPNVDTFVNLVKWLDTNQQASVTGCKLIDDNGGLVRHVRRFPIIWDQLAIVLKLPHFLPHILDKYLRVDFDYNQPAKVDSVRGGFFAIRRDVINKIGGLDERYFIWFEEVDYCRQIVKAGLEVWYTPATQCIDYVGQSFKQVKRGKTQEYFRESMLKYFKKWHPSWQYFILIFAWNIITPFVWLGEKIGVKSKGRT